MNSFLLKNIVLICLIWCFRGQIASVSSNHPGLSLPFHSISAEHVSKEFYYAIERSDKSKEKLQQKLHNFFENLQKNFSMSTVLSDLRKKETSAENYIVRMQELVTFFYEASDVFGEFSKDVEKFYDISKYSSHALLLKLRQIPTAQPKYVKVLLTNYFSEMEFFHMMFSEVVNDALEYTIGTLTAIQKIFFYYAETQSTILHNWKLKLDLECRKLFVDFLKHHSAKLFECAAGNNLELTYDIYAVTKLNVKFIMKQLEFRIQRLFNCFIFGSYAIQCTFLNNADRDFENLFSKLAELDMYLDIKTKMGRVSVLRRRRESDAVQFTEDVPTLVNCLSNDFPQNDISNSLKDCYYVI
ncbi:uncharacterized protein LOC110185387 [Drosophila serrata]|uniref:uncharacterized protein LOC110185387 n=1 Tax=Drosophila serrata TaxID=7274 RepID=UPI000A1D09CC|nr:uncharacterized protein LOC110185387 [Drosophila serrata]